MSTTNKKAYVFEMDLVKANLFSLIIFIIAGIITYLIFGFSDFFGKPFILTILIGYFALHELLHGIGYLIGGTKYQNISYGVLLEKGIFYCMSYQEITKKNIMISLLMPFIWITVVTYIIGLMISSPFLAWLSVVNFMGASMDLMMFFYLLRIKDVTYGESGQPNEFVLISSENLKNKKSLFFHVKDVRDYKKEDYEFKDFKRFNITKGSFIALLVVFGLDLINTFLLK